MDIIKARFGLSVNAKAEAEFNRVTELLKKMGISVVEYQNRTVIGRNVGYYLEVTGEKTQVDAVREWMFKFALDMR